MGVRGEAVYVLKRPGRVFTSRQVRDSVLEAKASEILGISWTMTHSGLLLKRSSCCTIFKLDPPHERHGDLYEGIGTRVAWQLKSKSER